MSTPRYETAFLFDVDNTLLDNDRVIAEFVQNLESLSPGPHPAL